MDPIIKALSLMHHKYPSQLMMWCCNLQLYPGCEAGERTGEVMM